MGVAVENVRSTEFGGEMVRSFKEHLSRMEAKIDLLIQERTVKDFYTVKEVAAKLGKAVYTVRDWCRLRRINAKKLPNGRGNEGEWRISHEELIRYQKEGLLPASPQASIR